jgi:glucosylceramidase
MKHLTIIAAICLSFGINIHAQQTKKAVVFTTAEKTSYKLTATDTLHFSKFVQPKETEISIFIDTKHTFQTMLGMGGALTDASAETFEKLPKEQQQILLKAYVWYR